MRLAVFMLALSLPFAAMGTPEAPAMRKPVLITTPEYPPKAFRKRRQGDVEVCFRILGDGSVNRAYVSSSSDRIFNRSALRAIRASRFEADPSGTRAIKACRKYSFRLTPTNTA